MQQIHVMNPSFLGNEKKYLNEAFDSSWIGGSGHFLDRFEREWANICGVADSVATSNGTVALQLALLGLGIGKGDEVIVPGMTYVATANAVRHVGADPVFVDIDPNTWCIDPGKIEDAITNKTKGIIPVHLFGHPADMDAIYKIARFYRLSVLADAAQSHLATYKGRDIGSVAEVSTYSFHVGKIFTCGEGGVITLSDRNLAQWLRTVRGHGMDPERRFFHMKTAFNFRLTNLQGAVLCGQIERRMEILEKRRKFFTRYQTNLKEVHGLGLQPIAEWAIPCPWVFCITIDPKRFGCTRDQLISILDGKGVESRPFYYPLHRLPAFRQDADRRGTILPIVDNLSKVGMYLPSSTDLSDHEVDYICEIIRSVVCK